MADFSKKNYCISFDDDPMIYRIIESILKVTTIPYVSAQKLLERAQSYQPQVVFIDIHLEGDESGLDILRELRQIWQRVPLIVMTSDTSSQLIGQALSLGANDFIRKPLDADELRARVQARSYEMHQRFNDECMQLADIACDRATRQISGPSGQRFLSASEWELLVCLAQCPGTTIPKQDLKARVWGNVSVSDNAVDRKISTLRQALKDVSATVHLNTVYGKGVGIQIGSESVETA